jgi:CheY-like chemotaxis protein
MPVISGIELAARINRLQPDLPIILFTGMNIDLLRQDAEGAGVQNLINKPLNRIELALTIRKVLDEAPNQTC